MMRFALKIKNHLIDAYPSARAAFLAMQALVREKKKRGYVMKTAEPV